MITIINSSLPVQDINRFDVVMFGTSIYGELMGEFQEAVVNEYPFVDERNMQQPYGDLRRLGTRMTVGKKDTPLFTLLYISSKNGRKKYFLHEDALRHSLETANNEFKGRRVICPVIGESKWEGGGERQKMLQILYEKTPDLNIFIFDKKIHI